MNFLVRLLLGRPGMSWGQSGFVPGTHPLCVRDKARVSSYFTQWNPICPRDKPSLSLGESRGRRAAEKFYVLNVYVPFSLASPGICVLTWGIENNFCEAKHWAFYVPYSCTICTNHSCNGRTDSCEPMCTTRFWTRAQCARITLERLKDSVTVIYLRTNSGE